MKEHKDSSHALDLVTVFDQTGTTAEMEALEIQAVLKAAGIRVVLGNEASFPNLPWTIRVPKADAARALRVIEDAKKAGPQAAEEAEAEQERSKK
jgi:hypothetical protein